MKRYNSCDINNMSFYEIIDELFSFKKISKDVNPFSIRKIILCDFDEKVWENNLNLEFDVSYNNLPSSNIITLSSVETGEILITIQQLPTMVPNIDRRWSYEISYCSFDFNPSMKITCGFGVMMGD